LAGCKRLSNSSYFKERRFGSLRPGMCSNMPGGTVAWRAGPQRQGKQPGGRAAAATCQSPWTMEKPVSKPNLQARHSGIEAMRKRAKRAQGCACCGCGTHAAAARHDPQRQVALGASCAARCGAMLACCERQQDEIGAVSAHPVMRARASWRRGLSAAGRRRRRAARP